MWFDVLYYLTFINKLNAYYRIIANKIEAHTEHNGRRTHQVRAFASETILNKIQAHPAQHWAISRAANRDIGRVAKSVPLQWAFVSL